MNYLAHAYLSFNEPPLLLGNMISDFVKGKKQFEYSSAVQQGIILHRAIDRFTDDHPATRAAMTFFRPDYRLYAGAFIDIIYDHFLANDEQEFPGNSLLVFSNQVYQALEKQEDEMPERFKKQFPYMRNQNWLYNYQYPHGIENSFGGLVRRASYLTESATAFGLFLQHYNALQQYYYDFFPAVKKMAVERWQQLCQQ
jgi:acyl carrier protein phosphodiesterase